MLDFGENFAKELTEWVTGLTNSFNPMGISRKISDYLEENPVPETFYDAEIRFFYDFKSMEHEFIITKFIPMQDMDLNIIGKLLGFSISSDFGETRNLNISDVNDVIQEKLNDLESLFDSDGVSEKISDYLEKNPMPKNLFAGIYYHHNLSTLKGGISLIKDKSVGGVESNSACMLEKSKGITLPDFKKSLYFLMDEYDLTATMIVADDLDTLESLYVRSVKGEDSFSDSYSSSDLGKVLDRNSSYFDKNYTGFRLYDSGKNDIFVVFRKLEPEAVLVNTSLRKSQLSAKKILSYF